MCAGAVKMTAGYAGVKVKEKTYDWLMRETSAGVSRPDKDCG